MKFMTDCTAGGEDPSNDKSRLINASVDSLRQSKLFCVDNDHLFVQVS